MRHSELDAMLKGRNAQSKKYANNTYLHRRGEDIALQYHSTDVATFKPNGDIVLTSGGWHTSTTKERINFAIGNRLHQAHGVWYIDDTRFADGMVIKADGSIEGGAVDNPKADRQFKSKAKAYAKLCADAMPLDPPGAGDCWHCLMVDENGQTLGDISKSDHIDSHIEEGYVVPSLVYHALKEAGNSDIIISEAFGQCNFMPDITRERIYRGVYRYILKRKGYAT